MIQVDSSKQPKDSLHEQNKLSKTVAIIGGGPAGLVSAKESLESGLTPTLFEKSNKIGGVWNPSTGLVWPTMTTNLTRLNCMFSDFNWSETQDNFPISAKVQEYLSNYALKFNILDYIKYNCNVVSADYDITSKKWKISWTEGQSQNIVSKNFDCLMAATGLCGKPKIPSFPGLEKFKGKIMHSSDYKGQEFKDYKRIVTIGSSDSGLQIAERLANYHDVITQIIKRPRWIIQKVVPNPERSIPWDLFGGTRENRALQKDLTPQQMKDGFLSFLETQTDQNKIPILNMEKQNSGRIRLSACDGYIEKVQGGQIDVKSGNISDFDESHIIIDNKTAIAADLLLFCTGYTTDISFLSAAIQKIIDYQIDDGLFPALVDRGVFHPDVPSLAIIGGGSYNFPMFELQARWASAVFSNKIEVPARKLMLENIEKIKEMRKLEDRPQHSIEDYWGYCDELAMELGAVPEFDKLKNIDPNLCDKVWKAPIISAQYRLNGIGANFEVGKAILLEAFDLYSLLKKG